MAARLAERGGDRWSDRGLRPIGAPQGFNALERLLRDGAVNAVMLPIDWARFGSRLPSGADRRFFESVAVGDGKATIQRESPAVASAVARLRALPVAARRRALVALLGERVLQVLDLDRSTIIDAKMPLRDLGLDSLMAIELRNVLTGLVGQPLPATLLFDYPTLDALAAQLSRVLHLDPANEPSDRPADHGHGEIEHMSDEDAEALLLGELQDDPSGRAHG
jgi:acyl carrier protein